MVSQRVVFGQVHASPKRQQRLLESGPAPGTRVSDGQGDLEECAQGHVGVGARAAFGGISAGRWPGSCAGASSRPPGLRAATWRPAPAAPRAPGQGPWDRGTATARRYLFATTLSTGSRRSPMSEPRQRAGTEAASCNGLRPTDVSNLSGSAEAVPYGEAIPCVDGDLDGSGVEAERGCVQTYAYWRAIRPIAIRP